MSVVSDLRIVTRIYRCGKVGMWMSGVAMTALAILWLVSASASALFMFWAMVSLFLICVAICAIAGARKEVLANTPANEAIKAPVQTGAKAAK